MCQDIRKFGGTNRIGVPFPNVEVKLVEIDGMPEYDPCPSDKSILPAGEIWIRGPSCSQGYYLQPEETAQVFKDGWVATGDIGILHLDDQVQIIDRKKNLVKLSRGGKFSVFNLLQILNLFINFFSFFEISKEYLR